MTCLEALKDAVLRLCEGCYLKWPYTPARYESTDDPFVLREVGEGDSHVHPRGGTVVCRAAMARAAIAEHEPHQDCEDDTCAGGGDCPCVVADRETRRARA